MYTAPIKFSGIVVAIKPQSGRGNRNFELTIKSINDDTQLDSIIKTGDYYRTRQRQRTSNAAFQLPYLYGVTTYLDEDKRFAIFATPHYKVPHPDKLRFFDTKTREEIEIGPFNEPAYGYDHDKQAVQIRELCRIDDIPTYYIPGFFNSKEKVDTAIAQVTSFLTQTSNQSVADTLSKTPVFKVA